MLMRIFWFWAMYFAAWTPPAIGLVALVVALCCRRRRRLRRASFALAFAAFAWTGYALWEGLRIPDAVEREIEIKGLPREFDGYRIMHFADLHACRMCGAWRTRMVVEKVNSCSPDLICATGDFVDGEVAERRAALEPLTGLRAKDGTFGVSGNHEIYSGYAPWVAVLRSLGIKMLETECVTIRRGNAAIALAGVAEPDFWQRRGSPRKPIQSLDKVYSSAPADATRILMQHRPSRLSLAQSADVRLVLSGHTHGGQIFGLDYIVRRCNDGHLVGLYREGNLVLNVTPGAGLWGGFPYRFGANARSELSLLVLRRAK